MGTETFTHPALFYRSDTEYLEGLVPFVVDGLACGDPVAAAVPTDRLSLLREALGPDAARVRLLDMTEAGRNPGRIIAGVLRRFADQHPEHRVRIIGEPIWSGRSGAEYPACVQHEALINHAFTGRTVTIVCPYDAVRLEPVVLADAALTHPQLWEARGRRRSDRYAPEEVLERYNVPLDSPPDAATYPVATPADVSRARRFAAERARELGLPAERVPEVELVVTELVTNSLVHAAGHAVLAVWAEDGQVICAVSDRGTLPDRLAGRRPSERDQVNGRGLLMVNDLADLVRVHTGENTTSIHACFRRPGE